MHSAMRAKQRLLRSSSKASKSCENEGGKNSGNQRPHVAEFGSPRSKSLDRKTTLRKVKDIPRAQSPKGKTNFRLIFGDKSL